LKVNTLAKILCALLIGISTIDTSYAQTVEYSPYWRDCRNCDIATENWIPKGWKVDGSAVNDYLFRMDPAEVMGTDNSMRISTKPNATAAGFGTLMQTISADAYRGQRVRFSTALRVQDVGEGAGLWCRVDDAAGHVLAFDNMQSRPVLGTQDWKQYSVVLDIPEHAKSIFYGFLLIGRGTLWAKRIKLEKVGADVPTTDSVLPKAPVNPNFSE
jgi:hypothetical protein